jgi:hypothetical protein
MPDQEPDPIDPIESLDALTGQPVTFGEARDSVLTPEGQIQSLGSFARGLGARRIKIAVVVAGALLLLLAVRAVLQ